ncbi:(S)-8-oxocitronellyl enol synthase CYC2-like [Tripterygium wilfordii]|uniref:(S)-8-oxocitronellyl enol synthase CYC2-like n=1 Tax=Tripterygium wilfordii TaxID=458696 RepID=UPI0018F86181|nr:(S)-8-oxocitronellyl enol synthase CYC2-like [Tripterygium wilfordii]
MAAKSGKAMAEATGSVAIIFGATGLVGVELAKRLMTSKSNWKVYGIARRPEINPLQSPKYQFISCDLLNATETKQKLSPLQDVTHIFWITWTGKHRFDSQECCQQNKEMMSNALDAVLPKVKTLKHVSIQTGMKHYVSLQGPWNAEEKEEVVYYNEERPRVGAGNFYYVLEDLIKERLSDEGNKVSWSVIRPGLLMGCSNRTLYNFIGSLCVYGAICKHLNLPFVFGGTRECWEEACIDGSDARLVAEQHIWAATNEEICSIHGQAFNAINGPSFTWKEIWPTLGKKFGVEVRPNEMFVKDFWYAKAMFDEGKVWEEIVVKQGLIVTKMEDLADWGFLDVLFRCPKKMLGSREKADRAGFNVTYKTSDSILYWIDTMRDEKLVP